MPIAALSDVHGNLPALEAVLAHVDKAGIETIVVSGDLAAGPLPRETLDRLLELGDRARFIRGNADREVLEAFQRGAGEESDGEGPPLGWVAGELTPDQGEFLAGLPEQLEVEVEGLGRILVCHGSPRTDMEILTERTPTPRLRQAVADVEQDVVICGHTHMQFDRTAGGRRVVNPGSVGLPYEGRPGAYWAILGPDVTFKRTEYDVGQAAELIRAGGYPNVEEFIAEYIVGSHDREEAMEFFEKLALDDPRFAGG